MYGALPPTNQCIPPFGLQAVTTPANASVCCLSQAMNPASQLCCSGSVLQVRGVFERARVCVCVRTRFCECVLTDETVLLCFRSSMTR